MRYTKPFSVVLLALVLPAAALFGSPKAVVPESVIDVGRVAKGEKIKRSFALKNEGTEALVIREVKSSCGCAVANFDESIAPGETGTIEAVVSTENFSGPIAKSVTVFTNDASNPQFNLVIKADIQAQIEVEPGYARFIVVEGRGVEESQQKLWTTDGPDLEIRSVKSPFPFLKVEHRRAEEDGRWQVDLKLDRDRAALGPMADFVEIETNHPDQRVVRIPVSGFVRPEVSVIPRIADLGSRKLDAPFTTSLEVRNQTATPITLESVSTDVPGVEATFEEIEEGKAFKVVLTLQPEMAKGPIQGKVRITTTSKRRPVVEVDLAGTIL